ncbi:aspartyl-phosphate phosphatase Spo0E family protein [Desulfoscipio gibsoniae]
MISATRNTEFDSCCDLIIRSKRKKNRGKLEEPNLPKLLMKIEWLRSKLNAMDLADRQKILLLSRKLDKLIAIYQRALFNMEENFIENYL